jgi:hypothetical protein
VTARAAAYRQSVAWSSGDGAIMVVFALWVLLLVSPASRQVLFRAGRALGRVALRLRPGRTAPVPLNPQCRPIEVIAREARRLGNRYRSTREGVSYAKSDAVRRAYDGVLGEWCDALGVVHLLGVLEPGDEQDAERKRVERTLNGWGLRLDDAV